MFGSLKNKILYERRLSRFRKEWRERNQDNFTIAVGEFPIEQVKVGRGTYGELAVIVYDDCPYRLLIGPYCSIAKSVTFLIGGEHLYSRLLTYPADKMILGAENAEFRIRGDTIIGADVWIGYGTIIRSGVRIGQGAVVAAGSVVAKDIPPYAIFAGGNIVKYRFSESVIEKLLQLDLGKIDRDFLTVHRELFSQDVTDELLEDEALRKL